MASKIRDYHLKTIKGFAGSTVALFASLALMGGCDNIHRKEVKKNPIYKPYIIQEEVCNSLYSQQREFQDVCFDQEKREKFSKLVEIASNNSASAWASCPPELKARYEAELQDTPLRKKAGDYTIIAFGIGFLGTVASAATYPLTMLGDYIYRRRKEKHDQKNQKKE